MTHLKPGESLSLGTRVDGGPEITRMDCDDYLYHVTGHADEFSRDELRRLAKAAGLEVRE